MQFLKVLPDMLKTAAIKAFRRYPTGDRFCISFQTIRKNDLYLREFLQLLDEEGIHYQAGDREERKLPTTATT